VNARRRVNKIFMPRACPVVTDLRRTRTANSNGFGI
jgi:hypothetical protein